MGQYDEAILWSHKAQALDPGNIGYVMREMWPQMDIGNTEALDPLIARMAVMDPDSSTLSFMEFWINLYKRDLEAAMEAATLFYQKTGYRPPAKFAQALVNMLRSDQTAFRAIAEEVFSAFYDRKTFQEGFKERPSIGCGVAWSLIRTGDEEMGLDLARQTIEYISSYLPGGEEGFSIALCYMVLDQPEQALTVLESAVSNGKVSGWWLDFQHPAYQLLQYEPRFIAVQAEIQTILAGQRENLQQMNLEAE